MRAVPPECGVQREVPDAAADALGSAAGTVAKREARTHAARFLLSRVQGLAAASVRGGPNSLSRTAAGLTTPITMNFVGALSDPSRTLHSSPVASSPGAIGPG